MANEYLTVAFTSTNENNPAGKLADAELRFHAGDLAGLKLIGFGVWEARGRGTRNVTFPARQYAVNGERRSFSLLRPVDGDANAQNRIRAFILEAYAKYEAGSA